MYTTLYATTKCIYFCFKHFFFTTAGGSGFCSFSFKLKFQQPDLLPYIYLYYALEYPIGIAYRFIE